MPALLGFFIALSIALTGVGAGTLTVPLLMLLLGVEEWADFAQFAALVGRGLVEQAVFALLFGDGLRGQQVDEVQLPVAGKLVAIGVGFGEVIAGVEKQHRDARRENRRQFCQKHIFGLKTAGQANVCISGERVLQDGAHRS